MNAWCSLYLPCADNTPVIEAARESLGALGYTLYNPFGVMPGMTYPQTVRLFVAPVKQGWTRVIGTPDLAQLSAFSRVATCLCAALDGDHGARLLVFADGEAVDAESALTPHLRTGFSLGELRRVLAGDVPAVVDDDQGQLGGVPIDVLPADLQALAGGIDAQQAQKLVERFSAGLSKRAGGDPRAAAALISGERVDWNSPGGRQIAALMRCLTVPDDWREPDFVALRDAYQLHMRRHRNPNARLYPGDSEALAAVPDALDYTPVFGGRNTA